MSNSFISYLRYEHQEKTIKFDDSTSSSPAISLQSHFKWDTKQIHENNWIRGGIADELTKVFVAGNRCKSSGGSI